MMTMMRGSRDERKSFTDLERERERERENKSEPITTISFHSEAEDEQLRITESN
jgi:hypothetical protein